MSDRRFLFLEGNNGATYIFNTGTFDNLRSSLDFYHARNLSRRLVKSAIYLYCLSNKIFKSKRLKSRYDVSNYLHSLFPRHPLIEIDDNISVLISPTRDKMVIHYHKRYFLKMGFDHSYGKIKNESFIYKLLNKKSSGFQVSSTFDPSDLGNVFSFKMSIVDINGATFSPKRINLVSSLLEFFNSIDYYEDRLGNYIDALIERNIQAKSPININALNEINNRCGQQIIPFGLVHKDFKPWNIKPSDPMLIFDFEEAVSKGLPLEDLFNYFIDPMIRYEKTNDIVAVIYNDINKKLYKNYLYQLKIGINFEFFLLLYLFERTLFWKERHEKFTSKQFQNLYYQLSQKILFNV